MSPVSFDLAGRVAIVTGAGSGLGREIALALARAGCDVAGAGRRPGPLDETAEAVRALGRRALARPTDVTDSAQVDGLVAETIAELGRVDVLVSNAGSYLGIGAKPLAELTDEEWRAGLDANLTGAVYCARAVLPHMTERGSGRIISIASGLGLRARRDDYVYSIAKAGVMQLTRALAVSHGRDGVLATAVAPGLIPLDASEQERASMGARQVAGRVRRPEEVGPVVAFLASDAAGYLNGVTLSLDGGAAAGGVVPAGIGAPAATGVAAARPTEAAP